MRRLAEKRPAGPGSCLVYFVLVLIVMPAVWYLWVEFVKLCVWLGQYTWP